MIIAWLYVVALQMGNDGLWYQGDAPRHAANGLFWWDFLTSLPVNPIEFALRYYARYPVINPASYPPVFYILEGAAFSVFGASPFVAKGLVLGFALFAALYMTVFLRRWISEEAGWGGALLVLQPGVILWANAIMLNVPSMALGLAALYHTRRWLDDPASRHIYPAACFALLGVLTYYPSVIVLLVILSWVVAERRWIVLWNRRTLALAFLSALVLLPLAYVAIKWAPSHTAQVIPSLQWVLRPSWWTFYLWRLPNILSASLLGLAVLSIVVCVCDRHWRREVKLALVWAIVGYVALSYIGARESRYALLLIPPTVVLSVLVLFSLSRWVATRVGLNPSWCFLATMAGLLSIHVSMAPSVRVPLIDGFQQVAAFFEKEAPNERIFYDGRYDGLFSFYLRAGDQQFKRGVVLGGKLLYASAIFSHRKLIERVSSRAEVVEVLRTKCGCRWLAIERGKDSNRIAAARYLRQAVTGSEFQFVRSFPIVSRQATHVDVYRFLLPIEKPAELELPFPILGDGVMFRVKPLER